MLLAFFLYINLKSYFQVTDSSKAVFNKQKIELQSTEIPRISKANKTISHSEIFPANVVRIIGKIPQESTTSNVFSTHQYDNLTCENCSETRSSEVFPFDGKLFNDKTQPVIENNFNNKSQTVEFKEEGEIGVKDYRLGTESSLHQIGGENETNTTLLNKDDNLFDVLNTAHDINSTDYPMNVYSVFPVTADDFEKLSENGTFSNGSVSALIKIGTEYHWPIKKEAVVEGDIILGMHIFL